jgi:hypothetical protein
MTERVKGTTGSDAWTCYLPTTPGVLGVPRGATRTRKPNPHTGFGLTVAMPNYTCGSVPCTDSNE